MMYSIKMSIVVGIMLILSAGSANSQTHFRNQKSGLNPTFSTYSGMEIRLRR